MGEQAWHVPVPSRVTKAFLHSVPAAPSSVPLWSSVYLLRYYRNAHGALLVYDIASKESFEGAKSRLSEHRKFGKPDVVILLVGNKLDLGKRWWRLPLCPHCLLKVTPNA